MIARACRGASSGRSTRCWRASEAGRPSFHPTAAISNGRGPMSPKTLYDKIWDAHLAHEAEDGTCLLHIDRRLAREVTGPQALEGLRMAGRAVRAPDKSIAGRDHNVP